MLWRIFLFIGHMQIDQENIRVGGDALAKRFGETGGFAHQGNGGFGAEQFSDGRRHYVAVIGEQNIYCTFYWRAVLPQSQNKMCS